MTRAFTNRPELAGTRTETGEIWEYVPEEPTDTLTVVGQEGGQPNPVTVGFAGKKDRLTPEQLQTIYEFGKSSQAKIPEKPATAQPTQPAQLTQAAQQQTATAQTPKVVSAPAKPNENAAIIDYSPEGREKFKKQIITDVFDGVDPNTINSEKLLAKKLSSDTPTFFNNFFRGAIRWESRERMTKDQAEQWNKAYNRREAQIADQVESKVKEAQNSFKYMLDEWDKQTEPLRKAAEKKTAAPTTKEVYDETTKQKMLYKWDESKQDWVNTGKVTEPAKKETVSGGLTENQVTQNLLDLAAGSLTGTETLDSKYADYYGKYRELVNGGMSREDAYNRILNESGVAQSTEASGTETGNKGYGYLWE